MAQMNKGSRTPSRANGEEDSKALVRRYVDAFNRGDQAALRGLFAQDAVVQGVLHKGGMDEILPIWRELHEGLAVHLTLDELVAEGDLVAARYTERGTFRGPFLGHPPTGRSYELVAMEWFVVGGGKIRERWGARDAASQARQIGLPLETVEAPVAGSVGGGTGRATSF